MHTKKSMSSHIPNFLTSMNVLSGSLAVILALQNYDYLVYSSILIVIASVFDFFDGLSARLLKAQSPMGKELDSLADMVSFGVAPGVIMFQLLKFAVLGHSDPIEIANTPFTDLLIIFFSCFIMILSAIRLAKFNVDTRQAESFIGLPTPAYALLIASIPLVLNYQSDLFMSDLLLNSYILLGITLGGSLLLVSEIPMFSLKFKNLGFADNKLQFFFLISAIVLIVWFRFAGITLTIIVYILLSIITSFYKIR